jgi:hypothetical protein
VEIKAQKVRIQYFQPLPQLVVVLEVGLAALILAVLAVLVVVESPQIMVVLEIHHQQAHHKVALVAQVVALAVNMVLVAVAVLPLLVLMEQHQ